MRLGFPRRPFSFLYKYEASKGGGVVYLISTPAHARTYQQPSRRPPYMGSSTSSTYKVSTATSTSPAAVFAAVPTH